jgi:hypothetical protein
MSWTFGSEMYIQIIPISKEANMQISGWGNSLAVRIPAKTVKALALNLTS